LTFCCWTFYILVYHFKPHFPVKKPTIILTFLVEDKNRISLLLLLWETHVQLDADLKYKTLEIERTAPRITKMVGIPFRLSVANPYQANLF